MTHSVVSAGATRLFAGMGFGVANARMLVIVVFMGALRLTRPETASGPVFTDQRSTPDCARRLEGKIRRVVATTRSSRRRKRSIIRNSSDRSAFANASATIHDSRYHNFPKSLQQISVKNSRFGPKGHAPWPG